MEQFRKFRGDYRVQQDYARTPDCPIINVTWYEAAEYCNWLSRRRASPKTSGAISPTPTDKFAEGMKVKPNYLELIGYRLPTEAEWEYACRDKAVTARYYGEDGRTAAELCAVCEETARTLAAAGGQSEAQRPGAVRHARQ